MKNLKEFWQLWGKYFMSLMRKTGLQMIIGSFFFSLGAGFVMSKQTVSPAIFADNPTIIFVLIASTALSMAMAEFAAELVDDKLVDDKKEEPTEAS